MGDTWIISTTACTFFIDSCLSLLALRLACILVERYKDYLVEFIIGHQLYTVKHNNHLQHQTCLCYPCPDGGYFQTNVICFHLAFVCNFYQVHAYFKFFVYLGLVWCFMFHCIYLFCSDR